MYQVSLKTAPIQGVTRIRSHWSQLLAEPKSRSWRRWGAYLQLAWFDGVTAAAYTTFSGDGPIRATALETGQALPLVTSPKDTLQEVFQLEVRVQYLMN